MEADVGEMDGAFFDGARTSFHLHAVRLVCSFCPCAPSGAGRGWLHAWSDGDI